MPVRPHIAILERYTGVEPFGPVEGLDAFPGELATHARKCLLQILCGPVEVASAAYADFVTSLEGDPFVHVALHEWAALLAVAASTAQPVADGYLSGYPATVHTTASDGTEEVATGRLVSLRHEEEVPGAKKRKRRIK